MKCRACEHEHSPLQACSVARRLRETAERSAQVVHAPEASSSQLALGSSRSPGCSSRSGERYGKYLDAEKRKTYRREWMRAKRKPKPN